MHNICVLEAHHLPGSDGGIVVDQVDGLVGVAHLTDMRGSGLDINAPEVLPAAVRVHLLRIKHLEAEMTHLCVRVYGTQTQVEILVVYPHCADKCGVGVIDVDVVSGCGAGGGGGLVFHVI